MTKGNPAKRLISQAFKHVIGYLLHNLGLYEITSPANLIGVTKFKCGGLCGSLVATRPCLQMEAAW